MGRKVTTDFWVNSKQGDVFVGNHSNFIIAEYHGWTNVDSPDGSSLRGSPPERMMRYFGSTRLRKAKKGGMYIPHYASEYDHMWLSDVESKLYEDGKAKAYISSLRGVCEATCKGHEGMDGDVEWKVVTADGFARCAAILIVLGHAPLYLGR